LEMLRTAPKTCMLDAFEGWGRGDFNADAGGGAGHEGDFALESKRSLSLMIWRAVGRRRSGWTF